ncbi:hypothetical protein R6Y99_21985 [Pseudomonas lundensis]|uniref:hypothetical protein n=2 Tax=Serratia TaxID=613 RepID=UPI002980C8B2|nr:hypothetical protein [Serratia proteamaculans]MDW5502472.1 hypothetical protein [Serratia proteamaculans]MDW5507528.1 hypothetical protein [Pseudomonas lundensis]
MAPMVCFLLILATTNPYMNLIMCYYIYYYLSGNFVAHIAKSTIFRYGYLYSGFTLSEVHYAMKRYSYPSGRMLEKNINTREGIAGLAKASLLEKLLKELDADGSEIGGAMLELNALVNYVTQNEKLKEEIKTHSKFITHQLEK